MNATRFSRLAARLFGRKAVFRLYCGTVPAGADAAIPNAADRLFRRAVLFLDGSTVFAARGGWVSPETGIVYDEPTLVVEVLALRGEDVAGTRARRLRPSPPTGASWARRSACSSSSSRFI